MHTNMAQHNLNIEHATDVLTQPCFFLDRLPPELRVRVYEYLILSDFRLIPYVDHGVSKGFDPPSSTSKHDARALPKLNLSLFLLNKQIYAESTDIFYTFNRFSIHYDDLCSCWSGRRFQLNEAQIKHVKILGINFDEEYYPRLWSRCSVCDTQGFWLIKYLSKLPRLRRVVLSFADVESFALCASAVARKLGRLGRGWRLEAKEIGKLLVVGTNTLIELRLPGLVRTWPNALARASEPCSWDYYDSDDENYPLRDIRHLSKSDASMYLALRDITYHAISAGTTTEELRPLMHKIVSAQGLHMRRLDKGERADFTIMLAGCLADIIADDENVHMADRRDLVSLSDVDVAVEKNGRRRASSALNLRPYSYITRF